MTVGGIRPLMTRLCGISRLILDGDVGAITQAREMINNVQENDLGKIPARDSYHLFDAPVIYAPVFEKRGDIHASLFGFPDLGTSIPLHNHPGMHGFIKCIRGAIKIRSFTLDSDVDVDIGDVQVRYEGESLLTPQSNCAYLQPEIGNIHGVTAQEDGTMFFDVLVPGYYDCKCLYYETPLILPAPGHTCILNQTGIIAPSDFYCRDFYYMVTSSGWQIDNLVLNKLFHNDVPKDQKSLEKQLCDFDIKKFSLPVLGEITKNTPYVEGPMVLQISKYRNVSIPRISEESGNSGKDGIIRLLLTDGYTSVSAVALADIKGINADTPPGTKILLTGRFAFEAGFMVITSSSSVSVLGGRVDKLVERWVVEKSSIREVGGRKNESSAPKWVSFGKKPSQLVVTQGFKANDVINAATKKENATENDDKFEQQRKEHLEAVDDTAKKTFAAPNVVAPPKPPPVERERKIRQPVNNDMGHDRRPKGRRGRKGSDDEEVPAEFARPSAPSTLFDFMSPTMAPALIDAQKTAPTAPAVGNHRESDRRFPLADRSGYDRGERRDRTDISHGSRGIPSTARDFNNTRQRDNGGRDQHSGTGGGLRNNGERRPPASRDNKHSSNNDGPKKISSKAPRQDDRGNGKHAGGGHEFVSNRSSHGRNDGRTSNGQDQRSHNQDREHFGGFGNSQRPRTDQRESQNDRPYFNNQEERHQAGQRMDGRRDGGPRGRVFQDKPFANKAPPVQFRDSDFPTVDEAVVQELTNMSLAPSNTSSRNRPFMDKKPSSQKPPPKGVPKWMNGQQCKAPWQDGVYYLATIVNIGPGDMCTVRYDEYGNATTVPQGVLLELN